VRFISVLRSYNVAGSSDALISGLQQMAPAGEVARQVIAVTSLPPPSVTALSPNGPATTSPASQPSISPNVVSWHSAPNERGTFSILTICVSTLALCVWTALHLNIPRRASLPRSDTPRWRTKMIRVISRKGKWVLVGMLAPELLVYLAWDQWLEARFLTRKMKGKFDEYDRDFNWSMTHSFFALMGGFTAVPIGEPDAYAATLREPGLEIHVEEDPGSLAVDVAMIHDRSKADYLAKTVVCIQASYLLVEVVGRLAAGLPLTLLEINTVAHVLCALCMYAFWFSKPLDVSEPISLESRAIKNYPNYWKEYQKLYRTACNYRVDLLHLTRSRMTAETSSLFRGSPDTSKDVSIISDSVPGASDQVAMTTLKARMVKSTELSIFEDFYRTAQSRHFQAGLARLGVSSNALEQPQKARVCEWSMSEDDVMCRNDDCIAVLIRTKGKMAERAPKGDTDYETNELSDLPETLQQLLNEAAFDVFRSSTSDGYLPPVALNSPSQDVQAIYSRLSTEAVWYKKWFRARLPGAAEPARLSAVCLTSERIKQWDVFASSIDSAGLGSRNRENSPLIHRSSFVRESTSLCPASLSGLSLGSPPSSSTHLYPLVQNKTLSHTIRLDSHISNRPGPSIKGDSFRSAIPFFAVTMATGAYGGLHVSPWHSYFATSIERSLWRASSIAIAASGGAVAITLFSTLLIARVGDAISDIVLHQKRRSNNWAREEMSANGYGSDWSTSNTESVIQDDEVPESFRISRDRPRVVPSPSLLALEVGHSQSRKIDTASNLAAHTILPSEGRSSTEKGMHDTAPLPSEVPLPNNDSSSAAFEDLVNDGNVLLAVKSSVSSDSRSGITTKDLPSSSWTSLPAAIPLPGNCHSLAAPDNTEANSKEQLPAEIPLRSDSESPVTAEDFAADAGTQPQTTDPSSSNRNLMPQSGPREAPDVHKQCSASRAGTQVGVSSPMQAPVATDSRPTDTGRHESTNNTDDIYPKSHAKRPASARRIISPQSSHPPELTVSNSESASYDTLPRSRGRLFRSPLALWFRVGSLSFSGWHRPAIPSITTSVSSTRTTSSASSAGAASTASTRSAPSGPCAPTIKTISTMSSSSTATGRPPSKHPVRNDSLEMLKWPLAFLYVVARSYIVLEAFLSLRALPPEAYQTPEWTSWWPKFGT
jgi:hypothetical protein